MRAVFAAAAFAIAASTPIIVLVLYLQNQDAFIAWLSR